MRRGRHAGLLNVIRIAVVLAGAPTGLAAQATDSAAAPTGSTSDGAIDVATAARGPIDRAELAAFIDGVMAAHLADTHVAGATVAVVQNGAVLLARGYGYADVATRTRVDPARTMFRIGSIAKLFTWTAVMQLVEAGQLDLGADVNSYLDFRIPDAFDEPITLRHILAHTPGFEEDSRDLFAEDSSAIRPMGEWLATHIPARVRAPGRYSSYSNYATALAGHIVALTSGQSWDEYIEERILTPLGMTNTTGRQPPPPQLAADMSNGYRYAEGRFEPEPFEIIIGAAPAGSISSTAADMATFMIAHLSGGAVGERRILEEATAARMHARGFAHHEQLPGFALGFYEKSSHGVRIIGHGGDTRWFHSDLALIPDDRLGVFVSYNTDTGGALSFGPFLNAFLDHYYPTAPTVVTLPDDAVEQAARVAGAYGANRMSYTTWQKAAGLMGAVELRAQEDGSLLVDWLDEQIRFVPIGPLLYREELGQELIAFEEDDGGRVTHAFMAALPMMAFERLSWYESPALHRFLLGVSLVVFAATVIAAGRRLLRRRFGQPRPEDELRGRTLVVVISLLNVAFAVALVMLSADFWALLSGPATGLKAALLLPVLAGLLTLGAVVVAVRHWREHTGTRGARLRYSGVVAASIVFLWSLHMWNLLGWRM